MPLVEDEGWFFDTELLVLAEHNGLRIHEVPVDWVDDPDSRVDVVSTAMGDLRGIGRMVRRFATGGGTLPPGALDTTTPAVEPALAGQLLRFAGVGTLSTALFAMLFLGLAGPVGMNPVAADVVALGLATAANTAANRRVTFARRGAAGRRRHYRAALVVALLPLLLTMAALVAAGWAGVNTIGGDLVLLTVVNGVAAAARFLLLRHWVFR